MSEAGAATIRRAPEETGRDSYRWVILAVGSLGSAAYAGLGMGFPSIGPALRDHFDLTFAEVGFLFACMPLGMGVTVIGWGLVTDRLGERVVQAVGLLGTCVALVVASQAAGFGVLVAALVVAAMSGGAQTGAGGRAVMGWFSREERAFAIGIRQTAVPLGGMAMSLLLPLMVALGGISAAMLLLAATVGVAGVSAGLLLREPATEPPAERHAGVGSPMADRRLWRLSIGCGLLVCAQSAIISFLAIFLHDERGFSHGAAGAGLACVLVGSGLVRLWLGRRSDRTGHRVQPMRALGAIETVLLLAVALLTDAPGAVLYPLMLLAGVLSMSWNGLAVTAAVELAGYARAGTAISLQVVLITLGNVVATMAFGLALTLTSWPVALAALAAAPLAAWAVLGPLRREDARAA